MIKRTLGLVLLMILLSSCFIKLDEKETKNENSVKINLSNVSRGYIETSTEKITVSLLNLSDGKEYLAEGTRESGTKKDMVLANIPYGNYSVSIKIYESGASEPYSIISSTLTVGKEVATFEGVVGGPNQAANLSGSLEYYEDEDGYYYVDFECDKVTSNYVSDTTGDTITYKLYGSMYEDFRDSELLITVTPSESRHPSNTEEEKIVFKLGKFSSASDSEIPTGITNGGTYYWKVVTCATVNGIERTCESDVKSVVSKKKVVNNLPNKVTNVGINPSMGEVNPDYSKFIWGHVTSVSNDSDYNDMTYILYVSTSMDFPDTSDTFKYEQNQTTHIQSWESGGIVTVSNSTTDNEFEDRIIPFIDGKYGTIYWRVEAINSKGSSLSDTFSFTIVNNLPNKVSSISNPLDGATNWWYSSGFMWEPVTSVSNNASYNEITYRLYISQDNFVDSSKTKILNQQPGDPLGGWFQSPNYEVKTDNSIDYNDLCGAGYFTASAVYYWKVEAINSAGSSMSDTFVVTHY